MEVGTRIKIIDAGMGAYGCNGLTGVVTEEKSSDGLCREDPGYNVRVDDGNIWRIRLDAMVFVNALDTTGRPITEWVNIKNIKEV